MLNKNGFCSVLGIIIVTISLLLGNFIIAFAKNEFETSAGFFSGIIAENLAQAGINDALVKLSKDNINFTEKNEQLAKSILYLHSADEFNQGEYSVYLSYKDEQPILLSIAKIGKVKRQVICYLHVSEMKTISIKHWDNKGDYN